MCSDSVKKVTGRLLDPLGLFEGPDVPSVKKPPVVDPEEQRRRAELAQRVRQQRIQGRQGHSANIKTSPLGVTAAGTSQILGGS